MEVYRERCEIRADLPTYDELDIDLTDESRPILVGDFLDIERTPYHPVGEFES